MEPKEIIREVRKTIEAFFEGKNYSPKIKGRGGAFVTLKKEGKLRACMGTLSKGPWSKNVRMAAISALSDPRFSIIEKEEFGGLEIEVSLLSEPKISKKPLEELEIGKHGLIIQKGLNSGLLLPQVATEHSLGKEKFLDAVCSKARLPKGAWKDSKIWLFTAQIYGEGA